MTHAADLRQRARVDAALDWHHWSIRRGAAGEGCPILVICPRAMAVCPAAKLSP